jgi:hypothetical protein
LPLKASDEKGVGIKDEKALQATAVWFPTNGETIFDMEDFLLSIAKNKRNCSASAGLLKSRAHFF